MVETYIRDIPLNSQGGGGAFLAISDQYATFIFLFTKWLPAAILDNRKSLSITFIAISDQYATLFFFLISFKMAAGSHFG